MPTFIIGLVGREGSGKGTAAVFLKGSYGAEVFRFSTILSDVLNRIAIERSRDNLIALSEVLRKTFGQDTLSHAMARDALTSKANIVVLDGIRRTEDIAQLEKFPNFRLIEISAPAEVRFERMKHRGEKIGESSMSWEKFLEEEKAPTEASITDVASRAWKKLDNSGTSEDLKASMERIMDELGVAKV